MKEKGEKMIYPKKLFQGTTIGITAPSDGIVDSIKQKRLEHAKQMFQKKGYNILETSHVRHSEKGKSAESLIQAKELESLFQNSQVNYIIAAAGGDFLLEILPYINWNVIKENPKWLQGYSDITFLLFILTTKYDIATVYASNVKDFGMNTWHESLENNLKLLEGNNILQRNFEFYEKEAIPYITGTENYNLTNPVNYQMITKEKEVEIKGRIIGGCIDCLVSLCGTEFDATKEFIENYKTDGIIWYFDNAELTMEGLTRALWQLKQNGWFQYVKGFLFGRMITENSYYAISKEEVLLNMLGEYQVPIISDMDFGHVPPRITIINGAFVTLQMKKNKMKILMEEKQ